MIKIEVIRGDVISVKADVLPLKHAQSFYGDLTEERPNVYLEVGYAWGLNKPVLLVAREGQRLHFDLSHHKCLFYKSLTKLAQCLEKTIQELFGHGGDST